MRVMVTPRGNSPDMGVQTGTAEAVPPAIAEGALHAFFMYDVADSISLERLSGLGGEEVARAPLQLRREGSPGSVQFPTPPLVARLPGGLVGERRIDVRAKFFDYGVVSLRLTLQYSGSWGGFAELDRAVRADAALVEFARVTLDRLLREGADALDDPHDALVEDYFVAEVRRFERPTSATELLGPCAPALACLIAGEERLGPDEEAEQLRARFSYFEDDLAVVQWDAAFVYDRRDGANATEDILEFANTQLVELRTYDKQLDAELDAIYGVEGRRTFGPFSRKAAYAAAERLRYLIVDVLELTDRSSNALKIIGDAYYARLYRAAAQRLGLGDWQRQLDAKIASVNDMYRFFADQAQNSRAEFTEIIVILLIAIEVVIGLLTLRHF
jgi:hypothetical protein